MDIFLQRGQRLAAQDCDPTIAIAFARVSHTRSLAISYGYITARPVHLGATMSSVPKIAAAQVTGPPPDHPASPRHLQIVPPPEPRRDLLLRAALDADACSAAPLHTLSNLWQDHIEGRLRFCFESIHPDRVLLVARECFAQCSLTDDESSTLLRVLCGEQQKVLSFELGVPVSTISSRYNRPRAKLGLARREMPLPLVLAAQCAAQIAPITSARGASFEHHGNLYRVVRVPAPDTRNMGVLTNAEQQVARWIIEGCSRHEIGDRRGTSVHTASHQFHSIFARLHASGRYALIRRAFELGCFRATQ